MTKPQTGGLFPAVILIAGSGPQDRNEDIAGHKVFWFLPYEASKMIILSGLNQLFQPAKKGCPEEYAWIETTFDQGAMETIADWLDGLTPIPNNKMTKGWENPNKNGPVQQLF